MMTTAMPAPMPRQAELLPSLMYELEATVVDLECALIETLTPVQFALVQKLRVAVESLTTAELAVAQIRETSRTPRRTLAGARDRRVAAASWLRARRQRRVA